ncbi:hypothetical protein HJP15_07455 [Pseudoalteromonas sp. NEC-BIFX-2020_002]|uniref:hypothetical protein n=1 Tax=Pseudoalteromonas sp. NEC-BIFX-2020_002 TaxID=2732353 RepID=UPI001476A0F2|nr:hypothetical protein [Pseudoalteromonas sp. NEC-BIFX-2020_002]NNG42754.1 hypothetical protein [Pseudoalteromonas sp. NEC-BIFX-2020_002]
MASLEEAYCIEYDDIIDAELAYDLYWAKVISSKSAFECPSEYCDAKVTCVNMDAEKQDMRQSPHFRGYNHSEKCDATIGKKPSASAGTEYESSASMVVKSDQKPDIFNLHRPLNQFAKKENGKRNPNKNRAISRRKPRVHGESELKAGSDYYAVRSLVTKFIRYRKDKLLSEHYVNIDGKDISYSELFKGVYKQQISALPDEYRIYWGVAYIQHIKEKKTYRIGFKSELSNNNNLIAPSFFVSENQIENYPVKNLVIKRLTKISKSDDKRAFIFLYSKPHEQGSNFINFDVVSLDYLEIRDLDLFEELKKTT